MRTILVTLALLLSVGATSLAQPVNHALNGTATQSTLGQPSGIAANAIDGNPDGFWPNGSMTHTANTTGSWWEVALTAAQVIDEIRLYNRSECCPLRLSNFRLTVFLGITATFQQDFYTTSGSVPIGDVEVVPMIAPTVGDRVRVELLGLNNNGDNVLSLAEVEVLQYGALPAVNIAPFGTASQSSTGSGGVPQRAIDGNRDGCWLNGSVSHTANNGALGSWWELDLASRSTIDIIRLWNRADCCANRLSNFRVSIFDGATLQWTQDGFTAGGFVPAGMPWTGTPPAIIGDRVRVELLGLNGAGTSILSLAECEVIRLDAGLAVDTTTISAATGGTQTMSIDLGTLNPGAAYLVAGTASGTSPGLTLSGFMVPLVFDSWTAFTLANPNGGPYTNTLGIADFRGRATATLTVPPGLVGLVGQTVHHVCGGLDSNGSLIAVTNATPVTMLP